MVMVITYKLKTDLSMNYCTVLLWFLLLSGSSWTKRHRSLSHSFKDLLVTLWCDLLYFDKIFDLSCIIWSKLFLEVFSLFFCFFVLVWWFRDAWLIWVLETYLKNRRWTKVMMTSVWNTQSIFFAALMTFTNRLIYGYNPTMNLQPGKSGARAFNKNTLYILSLRHLHTTTRKQRKIWTTPEEGKS